MPKRALFVGTRVVGPLGILLLTIHGCGNGSSSSSFAPGTDDAGTGGDDGSIFLGSFDDGGMNAASGLPTTCIVGTRGCLCDSTGGCAPPLTCTPQTSPQPSLCCNGADCTSAGGSIGATCSAVSGAPSCTPGITIPAGTTTNDNCGYAKTSFVESATICGINAVGGGAAKPAIIQVFYNDEHALTLGCATATNPVEPLSADPAAVHYPQTGDPACVDTMGRLLRPVLYVTDISTDPACTAGDQQKGGPANNPIAIFGTWKSAAEGAGNVGTPAMADPKSNTWDLTASADPVPAPAMSACHEGYGAELRFEVGLISGHSYRFQVIAHDGDQNKGGDSGEACAVFCAGSGTLCEPGVQECVAADAAACPSGTACVQGCCLTSIR